MRSPDDEARPAPLVPDEPEEIGEVVLARMLDEDDGPPPATPPGVVVGTLTAVRPAITVAFEEAPNGVTARSTVALGEDLVGCQVTLSFERGDLERPIITGVLQAHPQYEAEIDGQPMVLEGKDRIVLRCGKASIILTRAGKVIVKGTYVSSRSTGVHRIKGGSVQIN